MKKIFITFFILILVLVLGSIWWQRGITPIDKKSSKTQIFVIKKGEGIRSVAKRLKDEKLIRDQIVFFILIKKLGLDGKIQAGDFRLSPSMDTKTLLMELTHGTLDVWVTIPEGLRSEEIGEIFKKQIPSFNDSWTAQLKQNEGYLFPDTYLIPKDAEINFIIRMMRGNFDKKWQEIEINLTPVLNPEEVVILASIVEREAKFPEDRPIIAGVLLNRFRLNMPLQVDATVQYAIGKSDQTWWKKSLTKGDLKTTSAFNTYLNYGLPPTPISNPGLSSLKAANSPTKTNYLYYLSSKDGRMHYAQTFEEHNQNIEKYL